MKFLNNDAFEVSDPELSTYYSRKFVSLLIFEVLLPATSCISVVVAVMQIKPSLYCLTSIEFFVIL